MFGEPCNLGSRRLRLYAAWYVPRLIATITAGAHWP